jgi:hypothetical protein
MSSRSFFRFALVVLLSGWAGSYAMADNVIPWLTGGFWFENQVYLPDGYGGLELNQPVGVGLLSFEPSLWNIETTTVCYDEDCTAGYTDETAEINGGPIALHIDSIYGSFNLAGTIGPNGSFEYWEEFGPCYDICQTSFAKFSFAGVWDSGWHSTGDLLAGSYNWMTGTGTLTMTTTAIPEPGTIALLTTASFGVCGALRRKLRGLRKEGRVGLATHN